MKRIIAAWLVFWGFSMLPASLLAGSNSLIKLGDKFVFSIHFGLEVSYYRLDFPDALLTVKANPHDSLTRSTKVNFDQGWGENFRLCLRLQHALGGSPVSISVGTDLGVNLSAFNAYRYGTYAVTLSHYGGESYAYGQLLPAWYILNPTVGLSLPPLVLEVGFPYNQFTLITGNDRYGKWEAGNNWRWNGFGQRYYVGIDAVFGFGLSYEAYPSKFASQKAPISSWNLLLTYRFP